MYLPPHFAEADEGAHFALIEASPLGLLVSAGASDLLADHIPFHLDREKRLLQAHIARANPQWRNIEGGAATLVVFQSVDQYVTPSWYATKRETGKVVPTWNYVSVEVRGTARVIDDTDWLRQQINHITAKHEVDRPTPWSVADAPDDFIAAQMKGIIGIEIAVSKTIGKWKVSQNRPAADRESVLAGLQENGSPEALEMAEMLRQKHQPAAVNAPGHR